MRSISKVREMTDLQLLRKERVMKKYSVKDIIVAVLLVGSLVPISGAFAQFEDTTLESDTLDVSGRMSEIDKARERLAKKVDKYVDDQVDNKRLQKEKEVANEISNMFNNGPSGLGDDSSLTPQATTVSAAPAVASDKSNKITIGAGMSSFSSEDIEDQNAIGFGIDVEKDISDRFAIGLAFGYTNMSSVVDHNSFGFAIGRGVLPRSEINYNRYSLDIYGKAYFSSRSSRIRPYVGLGIGYNNSRVEFNKQDPNYYDYGIANYSYYNDSDKEGVVASTAAGSIILGSEINLGDNIGFNVSGSYRRSLTSSFGNTPVRRNHRGFIDRREDLLRRMGESIEDSHEAKFNVGLIVRF